MIGADFIHLATRWAVLTEGEPIWRSSISRAYYGALHHCREFIEASLKIGAGKLPDLHIGIPRILQHSGNVDLVDVGDQLTQFRLQRNDADYKITVARFGEKKLAMVLAETSKAIEATVTGIQKSADLKVIQQTIKPHLGVPGPLFNWHVTAIL